MGHLDPFFQELNGIGILALIVTIIAVIVRVVFCKTMRARIYTGVLGLISAIVMSLGIDYAIRPFAGTGESTATNGLGFVQLMIGVVIALIGGAVLRGILSLDDGEPQPTSNSLIMDTQTELNRLAPRYGLVAAMSNEDSYYGWFMIDHDNGGSPDPLYEASLNANLQQERQLGKLYGDPGSGLDYSAFGNTAVQAGQQGESALARIIAYMQLNVISFWSLYGLNENRQPINADIDCVLVGIDPQQQVHAWFVDAKNYKGGSDTKYVNLDPRNLVRMSISRRALIKGSDGTPVVKMSENMATQRDNWASTLETYHVAAQWMVCMVPGGHNGTPDVSEATWPGGIRVVTPEQLVAEIRSVDLLPIDNIPQNVFEVFGNSVKMRAIREHKNVPLTPDVPRITQKTATPTATVAETAPQPAQASPATVEPNENAVQQPDEPEPAARPNYCPNCGQKLEEMTNFCPNCGKPVA